MASEALERWRSRIYDSHKAEIDRKIGFMARYNFDNLESDRGWFVYIIRMFHRRQRWWYKNHPDLGESPLSALCDDRFEDVYQAALAAWEKA